MSHKTAVFVTMLVVFSAMAMAIAASDDSDAAPILEERSIEGYVGKIGETGTVPVDNAIVNIYTDSDKHVSTTTDTTGKFRITAEFTETDWDSPMKFVCEKMDGGYTVLIYREGMTYDATTDSTCLDLSEVNYDSISKTYRLCEDLNHCILVENTLVDVSFIIGGTNSNLKNAEITLKRGDETIATGRTNGEGQCKILDLNIGEYTLEVECNGYKDFNDTILITKTSSAAPVSITMDEKKIETYYGMTTYHILMIMGVVIGLILVGVSYVLCFRSWKRVDSDDLKI